MISFGTGNFCFVSLAILTDSVRETITLSFPKKNSCCQCDFDHRQQGNNNNCGTDELYVLHVRTTCKDYRIADVENTKCYPIRILYKCIAKSDTLEYFGIRIRNKAVYQSE